MVVVMFVRGCRCVGVRWRGTAWSVSGRGSVRVGVVLGCKGNVDAALVNVGGCEGE